VHGLVADLVLLSFSALVIIFPLFVAVVVSWFLPVDCVCFEMVPGDAASQLRFIDKADIKQKEDALCPYHVSAKVMHGGQPDGLTRSYVHNRESGCSRNACTILSLPGMLNQQGGKLDESVTEMKCPSGFGGGRGGGGGKKKRGGGVGGGFFGFFWVGWGWVGLG